MFSSSSSAVALAAFLSLLNPANALYDASAKTNLAVYWGQGPNQLDLVHFCEQSTIDIINLAFVHVFPAQGNGYPGDNFGNKCSGSTYTAPGYDGVDDTSKDALQSSCPTINRDIPVCQSTYGKKIILSLGGGTSTYQLTGADDGVEFANFLWGAFGPQTSDWIAQGLPRPFDGADGSAVEVDGFDFDIETAPTDQSAGYIAMINQLRTLFATASKEYIITGAPQCVVPDANMGTMITDTQFDILFVQFYNTPYCSARTYVDANGAANQFSYDQWSDYLVGTASANAKIYIGLPASSEAAGSAQNYWLDPDELAYLTEAFYCRSNFGGVMLWEATYAENNVVDGAPYYDAVKEVLLSDSTNPSVSCASGTATATRTGSNPTSTGASTPAGQNTSPGTSAPSSTAISGLTVSTDGSCGGTVTCKGNPNGQCCSKFGYCGATDLHCGTGCQPAYGICGVVSASQIFSTTTSYTIVTTTVVVTPTSAATSTATPISGLQASYDGSCGPGTGKYCANGNCCSQWGWCGAGDAWCGTGCQVGYGTCSA